MIPNADSGPARDSSSRLHPAANALTAEALEWAARFTAVGPLLAQALPRVLQVASADFAAVVVPRGARWEVIGQTGGSQPLPNDQLREALDRDAPLVQGSWSIAPLAPHSADRRLLVLHFARPTADSVKTVAALAAVLAPPLATVTARSQDRQHIEHLEAILQIAGKWNQTYELEPLLQQMAEAATRLLGSDRASIFLWDKPNHLLIGRPALGVEGGELRIPDDAGVVGYVVRTGEPKRVDVDLGQQEISRQVDCKLGYQTKTLLCVPLRSRTGRMLGAFEAINKLHGDFTDDDLTALTELAKHAAIALENTQQWEQLVAAHRQLVDQAADDVKLIGQCPAIAALRSTIRRVADTELAVLILGENGTGKEVVSQLVHYLSPRRAQPFVAVNCAAIAETLLESELFGHEKGAFTDAHEARAGKFELASGGTLLLDEIGDLSRGGQAKLLRVLEEKVVVRVGGSKTIHTDVRVIAATNQNLAQMVREKKFREDLFFRLNVVTLDLPPLRERGEDVLLLADHFLEQLSKRARRTLPKLSAGARKRLLSHSWPGNIRELRNLMERLVYLSTEERVEAEDLAFVLSPGRDSPQWLNLDEPLAVATNRFQSNYIEKAIERTRGNMSEAAGLLGLHRSNLYRKMRQLGMNAPDEDGE